MIGTYSLNDSLFDVGVMIACGVGAYILNKVDIHPGTLALGLILGPIANQGFTQGMADVPGVGLLDQRVRPAAGFPGPDRSDRGCGGDRDQAQPARPAGGGHARGGDGMTMPPLRETAVFSVTLVVAAAFWLQSYGRPLPEQRVSPDGDRPGGGAGGDQPSEDDGREPVSGECGRAAHR